MRGSKSGRSAVSFIAWSSVSGRSEEIAEALGGDSRCFYDFGIVDSRFIPIRYLASAVRTVLFLLWRRPRAVIASNPPIFPGAIAYLYGRLTGARVVLDSHPLSFLTETSPKVVTATMPISRRLVPRVDGVMVTVDDFAEAVHRQGGKALVLHEAPPLWQAPSPPPLAPRPLVLLVGIFAGDEPVDLAAEAAWRLPDIDFQITGDLRRCPPELLANKAPNVEFVGFLDQAAYRAAFGRANVIVTLTERAEDVSRVASEAVSARRPLIVSDWPAARRYYPYAVPVENTVDGVAAGVRRAVDEYDELSGPSADRALAEQAERWQEQLAGLRGLIGSPG
jgi:hypothetical protein